MSDINQAVQDLLWLSDRLAGLASLKDSLKDYSDLQNKTVSLQAAEDQLRKDITDTQAEKSAAEAQVQEVYTAYEAKLAQAKADEAARRDQAETDLKSRLAEIDEQVRAAQDKADAAVAALDAQVLDKQLEVADLVTKATEASIRLKDTTTQFEALKSALK